MRRPDFYVKGPTACSEVLDPEIFVPDYGDRSSSASNQIREAKEVCQKCQYKPECLAWALYNNEVGVWGGTSDRERANMRRRAILTRTPLPLSVK